MAALIDRCHIYILTYSEMPFSNNLFSLGKMGIYRIKWKLRWWMLILLLKQSKGNGQRLYCGINTLKTFHLNNLRSSRNIFWLLQKVHLIYVWMHRTQIRQIENHILGTMTTVNLCIKVSYYISFLAWPRVKYWIHFSKP